MSLLNYRLAGNALLEAEETVQGPGKDRFESCYLRRGGKLADVARGDADIDADRT